MAPAAVTDVSGSAAATVQEVGAGVLASMVAVLSSIQSELIIFCLALIAHALFFGSYRVKSYPAPLKHIIGVGGGVGGGGDAAPQQQRSHPRSGREGVPKGLLQAAERIVLAGPATERMAQQLRTEMARVAADYQDPEQVLLLLLEGAGRAASPGFVEVLRGELAARGLRPGPALGELLLKACYGLQLHAAYAEVLQDVEATTAGQTSSSIQLLALRSALRSGDFNAACDRFRRLHHLWTAENGTATPSAAPQSLVQQLVRLGVQQQGLEQLLALFLDLGFLSQAFDTLMNECAADAAALHRVEELGRSKGVVFSSIAYAALITGAVSAEDALRTLDEASRAKELGQEPLTAAAAWALAHQDQAVADRVCAALPAGESAPPQVASKLLRLIAGPAAANAGTGRGVSSPVLAKDAAGALLQLYKERFYAVDFSSDCPLERLLADAALLLDRGDVFNHIVATCGDLNRRVALIKSYGAERRLLDAMAVFDACSTKSTCLYNTVIDVCIDCSDTQRAAEVMSIAVAAEAADIVTYNTMVKAYLLGKDQKGARKTLEAMRTSGQQPNAVTFNELLDASIATEGTDKAAWALIDEMKAVGVKPNHITCSILLKGVQKDSSGPQLDRIIRVLDDMETDMDEVLLSSVVEACIRGGRADLLVHQLRRYYALKRIQVKGPHTYGSIIRAYGFVHDIHGVWDTWREMRTRHVMPTSVTLGCMVEALVTNGAVEAGYELIGELLTDSQTAALVNAVIYCSVLKGFSHQKRFDRVWATYHEMLKLKLQFSIVTFNTLVDACARCGELAKVPTLLQEMTAQGIEPNIITYSTILKGYCQENRLDEAIQIKEEMLRTTNFRPDEIMYNTLLDGCARQGLLERGMPLLEEMQAAGIRPTNFTLSVLVKLAGRGKQLNKAFELCEELSSKYKFRLNVHVYNNLVAACISHKDLPRALEVVRGMARERVLPDTRTYTLLLNATSQAGDVDTAAGLLRAAFGLRGAHPVFASGGSKAHKLPRALPAGLVAEVLENIARHDDKLAMILLKSLNTLPDFKLDSRVQMRLTTHALQG